MAVADDSPMMNPELAHSIFDHGVIAKPPSSGTSPVTKYDSASARVFRKGTAAALVGLKRTPGNAP